MKRLTQEHPPQLHVYGWAIKTHDPRLIGVVSSESDADALLARHLPGVGAGYVFLVTCGPLMSCEVVAARESKGEP